MAPQQHFTQTNGGDSQEGNRCTELRIKELPDWACRTGTGEGVQKDLGVNRPLKVGGWILTSVSDSNFSLRFYLFIHERDRERGRDIGRERSRLHAGTLIWDSIPGP